MRQGFESLTAHHSSPQPRYHPSKIPAHYNRRVPPRLIINADDFGLTPGINRAILELHQAGVLSSATLMATGPTFEQAAALAVSTPTLGTGCHLVFVDGIPISHPLDIPTLLGADGKTFRPSALDFAQAVLRGTIRPADLARETQAQIQKLQRAGVDVTHIDSHKHTHLFPSVARTVLHIAQRCGVPAVRNPFELAWARTASKPFTPFARRLQISLLHLLQPGFQALLPQQDDLSTSGTAGISLTGTLTQQSLRALLATAPLDTTLIELCCHPGHIDSALDDHNTRLRASREIEHAALLSVIPQFLRTPGAPRLIHYGNLGIPGHQRATGQWTQPTGYEKVL